MNGDLSDESKTPGPTPFGPRPPSSDPCDPDLDQSPVTPHEQSKTAWVCDEAPHNVVSEMLLEPSRTPPSLIFVNRPSDEAVEAIDLTGNSAHLKMHISRGDLELTCEAVSFAHLVLLLFWFDFVGLTVAYSSS